ncbi:cellulose synthase subunit BcsC-related outer membrane protein [Roseomonas sp. E05]|uniref:cellulose biosynthesis protein BcsC n=1 Tax=Roseomonas sp. E05 TaxID=3046310 RepID=UPI0024B88E24|nr:cellulose biosynthesis protein BcsC [Roseomonas sp. E05]MDJ0388681.1 cellulose synthase subunit BcsC-related outer membrane protein [Roseomonas sp. E05]
MTALRARLLAGVFSVAAALPLLGPASASAQENAISVLLEQANYWRNQNRPDRALQTLERVLTVEPNNVDALAAAAAAAAEAGNPSEANGYLARLRKAAPADPRNTEAARTVRGATVDPGAIAEARRLAQSGQAAAAVERYRQLFGGGVPPDPYAIEYYQTLAGTQDGYGEARDAMERLVERNPKDPRLALSYAQILTYREGSRAEGIRRLRDLTQQPSIASAATAAWRQALLWQGPDPDAIPGIEEFLRTHPNDPALQKRLEEARNPPTGPPDEVGAARIRGFAALDAGRLSEAAQAFETVLEKEAKDADAKGGLGIVRLRQGRNAEARRLLTEAIALDPREGRRKWGKALEGANFTGELNQARALLNRGQTDAAEALLQRTVRRDGGDRADAEVLLGDIALRRDDPTGAEQHYRAALSRRPNLAGALAGLYDALQRQGRFAEAEQLAQQRGTAFAATAAAQRAEALRAEANRAGDPEAALALLRAALAADADNPWVRLDLARALAKAGQAAEGRALVEQLAASGNAEALHAAALFADEEGRTLDAARFVERIPERLRSADQSRLLRRARVQQQVAAATEPARYGRPDEARRRLLSLAAHPDPSGETASLVVEALSGIGDRAGAAEAARVALAVNRGAPPSGRIAIAGALMEAGLEQEAAQLASQLAQDSRLTADERRQLAGLHSGFAIRASDRLNEQGNQAAAYDQLAPVLMQNPQDPGANMALARLYQGAREPREAQRIAEAVLSRDPRNAEARSGAIEAAIALGQRARAEALLAEGRSLAPNDPRMTLLEARLARAGGDTRRARAALQLAAEQRRSQLGVERGLGSFPAAPGTSAAPTAAENPFRRVALAGQGLATSAYASSTPADPLLAEISREYAAVQDQSASYATPGFSFRSRSGEGGLDQLVEVGGSAEVSTSMPGIGGRIALRAQAVSIDSGAMEQTAATLRRFGSNALYLPGPQTSITSGQAQALTPRDSSAAGMSFGLGYNRDSFSLDVGTTPLGFRKQNLVGGIEVAPALSDNLRLRVTGERRAMTDTLLSWAGQRDPATGQIWGGVVRNTARGQLEYGVGDTNFYAGGGYSTLEGDGVADNTRIEAGLGLSHAVFRNESDELVAGLDLFYQSYDKNLRLFTLGHGGYYSPQSYVSATVPVDYRARSGNLAYRVGASVGIASWREDRAPYFPTDAARQAQLEAQAAADSTIQAFYPGQSQTGFIGGLRGDLEYALTPALRLGAALHYDKSADWSEARGLLYARYRLDQ